MGGFSAASYYPRSAALKEDIIDWLAGNRLGVREQLQSMNKDELLRIVNGNRPRQDFEVTTAHLNNMASKMANFMLYRYNGTFLIIRPDVNP